MAALVVPAASAGNYTLPFTFVPSEETFAECTVIDVDDDKETDPSGTVSGGWAYYGSTKYAFKYSYHMSNQADDWLILPAVDFGDCTKVKVSFQIETYSSDKEDFEVKLGHEPTVDGMTQTVMTQKDFLKSSFGELSAEVTVPDDGNTDWHLGFHVTSPACRGWIYIKDIKIENAETGETVVIPAAPVVKSSTVSDLDYSAVITMPAADTKGEAIADAMSLKILVDGTVVETKTDCAAGSDVNVALTLTAGQHTVGYQAVLGDQESATTNDEVEAKEHLIVPSQPVIKESAVNYLVYSATVTMPALDTDGNEISGLMSLKILVDGTVVETKNYLSAGADVTVSRNLSAGSHTVGFIAVLDGQSSAETTAQVEAKEHIYSLPFVFETTAANFAECVVIDVNDDGAKTSYEKNGKWVCEDNAFVYTYHDRNAADDWVMLPLVDLGDVKKVKVTLSVKTVNYPENFELMFGAARTISSMTVPVMKYENYKSDNKDYTKLTATVELPADASSVQSLGIRAFSEADKYIISINNIKIEDASAAEIIPSEPVIKESATENLSYSAVVTMPTLDTAGKEITGEMSLEISVDDEVVETKTGCAAGSDVDVNLSLEAGNHTIGYKALLGENYSAAVTESVKATSITTGALPFTLTASQETFDQCKIIDVDGSENNYGNIQGVWSYVIGYGFKYTYRNGSQADDWLMLPLIDFGESSLVRVSVDVKTEYDTEDFEIYLGREQTIDAMTIEVMKQTKFVSNNKWTTLTADVAVPAAVTRDLSNNFTLGIHAISPAGHYNMYFDNIRIESLSKIVSSAIDVETDDAAECEYYNLQGMRVVNPESGIYIVRKGSKVSKVRF